MHHRRILLAVFALALGACSGLGRQADHALQQSWSEQQDAAAAVRQWDMYARAVLRLDREVYNIGIRWQRETDGRFMMLLEAPFGQGVLRIDAHPPDAYELLLPDGRRFVNSSVEALLDDAAGWSLPIGGLDFWIRGLPRPQQAHAHRLDGEGRARSIRQDDWDIVYLDYFEPEDGVALPRRHELQNEAVTLRLAIERWQAMQIEAGDTDLFPSFN